MSVPTVGPFHVDTLLGGIAISALDLGLDGRVLAFTAAITLVTGLIFGLAPTMQGINTAAVARTAAPAFRATPGASRARHVLTPFESPLASQPRPRWGYAGRIIPPNDVAGKRAKTPAAPLRATNGAARVRRMVADPMERGADAAHPERTATLARPAIEGKPD